MFIYLGMSETGNTEMPERWDNEIKLTGMVKGAEGNDVLDFEGFDTATLELMLPRLIRTESYKECAIVKAILDKRKI